MPILSRNERDLIVVDVWAPTPWSGWNFQSSSDCWFTTRKSSDPVPSLANFQLVATYKVKDHVDLSYRERNPFDSPPGLGFHKLRSMGEFIRPNILRRTSAELVGTARGLFRSQTYITPLGAVRYVWHKPAIHADAVFTDAVGQVWNGDFGSAEDQALSNLYGSLQRRQKIAGGVILAELKESVNLVGKAVIALVSIVRALKRGRVKEAIAVITGYHKGGPRGDLSFRHLRNRDELPKGSRLRNGADYASSSWLELQFGWLPILQDIYTAIQMVAEGVNLEEGRLVSVKGYGTQEISAHHEFERIDNTYYGVDKVELHGKGIYRVQYQASFRISDSTVAFLQSIGLTNPASIAWEIVPFSFVVDWFIPVNAWLNGLTATVGLELLDITVSNKIEMEFSSKYKFFDDFTGTSADGLARIAAFQRSERPTVLRYKGFSRTPNVYDQLPPMPTPKLSMADFTKPWLAITSSSLLFQLFGRKG